ncbi:MAG: glucose-1-phosphate cytidylyltransferase [Steroidobacteraceae bacterium]
MKVVLFCGGLGTRLREHSDTVPKSLVNIGVRPIVWHLMRYYAHFGHKDFILCLGYRGDMVRDYFLNYNECLSNDFTISDGGRTVELHSRDIADWRVTFVDTGLHANIGQRLLRVRKHLMDQEVFLANYSDGLSDLPLDAMIDGFRGDLVARFAAVRPSTSFHAVQVDGAGMVSGMGPMGDAGPMVNGGFFVLRRTIFDYIREGEELVEEPFQRLIEQRKLGAFAYSGFWKAMDTFKDKISFDRLEAQGRCPWKVWLANGDVPVSGVANGMDP